MSYPTEYFCKGWTEKQHGIARQHFYSCLDAICVNFIGCLENKDLRPRKLRHRKKSFSKSNQNLHVEFYYKDVIRFYINRHTKFLHD